MFSLVERRRSGAGAGADAGAGAGARFRRSAGGWLAAGVAGALLLSGCSGSGEPDADAAETPSVSPSATPPELQSPSPSPSAVVYKPASAEGPAENVPLPVMPEEAKVESKEGLIAFARHWYDLVNYGYETGDPEPLKAISGTTCAACTSYYSALEKGYVGDDWLAGSMIEITSIASQYVLTENHEYQVQIMFVQEPIEAYGPTGHYGNTGDMEPFVQLMEASFKEGTWTANQVVTIGSTS